MYPNSNANHNPNTNPNSNPLLGRARTEGGFCVGLTMEVNAA